MALISAQKVPYIDVRLPEHVEHRLLCRKHRKSKGWFQSFRCYISQSSSWTYLERTMSYEVDLVNITYCAGKAEKNSETEIVGEWESV